ncbi:sugar transferase [Algoriphagus sp. Y33]|uniref:sugar transferase n=1 Tax=Algoriphagus sp. Y33 TaxID=2772483 RepID=UPI0017856B52|nr:sugar transferase [Algoriphagus sp. Y33]
MKNQLVFINPNPYLPERILESLKEDFEIETYNDTLSFVQRIRTISHVAVVFVYGDLKSPEFINTLNKIRPYSTRDGFQICVVWEHFDFEDKKNAVKNGISSLYLTGKFLEGGLNTAIKKLIANPPLRHSFTDKQTSIPIDRIYRIPLGKRIFDILVSGLALLLLSPLFLTIALLIRMESKGPIFYRSKRVGRGWDIISFYKFRTMVPDAESKLKNLGHLNQYSKSDGHSKSGLPSYLFEKCEICRQYSQSCENPLYDKTGRQICETIYRASNKGGGSTFFKLSEDPRITKLGKFLRNSSLDELPQLLNVFKGDMSIVGNRPIPVYEAEKLTTDQFSKRFLAPAGITGLWQVTKRGKSSIMSEEERIGLDNHYADNYSLWLDLKILLMTLPALFQKENV